MYAKILLPLMAISFWLTSKSTAQISTDTLLIGYTQAPPFIVEDDRGLHGISIWLWEKVAEDLGIHYAYRRMNFKNLLDSLNTGSIDLSINPLTVTSERNRTMDFTHSFFVSNSTVAIQKSSSIQRLGSFVRSFFSVIFLRGILLLLLIIGFFGVLAWLLERKNNPEHFRNSWKGVWDGLWWSAVTMTTVGYGDKAPKSSGGKIVALIWMFAAIMFISGFTASIASSLTVNQMKWAPKELNDFKAQSVGSVRSSSAVGFLRDHFFKDIHSFNDLHIGLEALKNGKIKAFLYDEPILKYRIAEKGEFSDLEVLPIKFDVQFYAFAFAHGREQIRRKVSQKILQYIEGNDWKHLLAEYDLSQL